MPFYQYRHLNIDEKMLLTLAIATLIAILSGKLTIKGIKKYVKKRKNRRGDSDAGRDSAGDKGAGDRSK